MRHSEFLIGIRCILQLYKSCSRPVREKYGLTRTEFDILAFLANNPGLDTASDIVGLRRLPKANVSQAVESLIGKGLLLRRPDLRDRRRIHLAPTGAGQALLPEISAAQRRFFEMLLKDFSHTERELFLQMNARIVQNAHAAQERMDSDDGSGT